MFPLEFKGEGAENNCKYELYKKSCYRFYWQKSWSVPIFFLSQSCKFFTKIHCIPLLWYIKLITTINLTMVLKRRSLTNMFLCFCQHACLLDLLVKNSKTKQECVPWCSISGTKIHNMIEIMVTVPIISVNQNYYFEKHDFLNYVSRHNITPPVTGLRKIISFTY